MYKFVKAALFTAALLLPATAMAGEFYVTSTDITEGQPLSEKFVFNGFGCEGDNVSPALKWADAPAGTKSFVVTAYDPDAPTGSGWWHWVAFNIPASTTSLASGASSSGMPKGTVQSMTDFGKTGFGGACPPEGKMHRYVFTVFALKVEKLNLKPSANPALVGFMTRAKALASASITATYTR